jgi:hypothetical protein
MKPDSQLPLDVSGLSPADRTRLEYDALTRQLERMRAMQYAYNRKFFALLLVSTLVAGGLIVWDRWMGLLLVCFGLVTTGVTASFFLHFCDFARVHARAVEARINVLLGRPVLIASELEADYFYPHASPKFSGFSFERPSSFFSVYTLHFTAVWGGMVLWSSWRLKYEMDGGVWGLGFVIWCLWSGLHGLYLKWWFMESGSETRMARHLAEAYGLGHASVPPVSSRDA